MFQEEEAHYMRLVSILHDLLLCETEQKDKKDELHRYVIIMDIFYIYGHLFVKKPSEIFDQMYLN